MHCTPWDCTDTPKVSLEQHLVPRVGQSARKGPRRATGEGSSALLLPSLQSMCSSAKEGKPEEICNGTFFSIVFPLLGLHLLWPSANQPSGVGENCTAPFVGLSAVIPPFPLPQPSFLFHTSVKDPDPVITTPQVSATYWVTSLST